MDATLSTDDADPALVKECKRFSATVESCWAAADLGGNALSVDTCGWTAMHWLCLNPHVTVELIHGVHKIIPTAIHAVTTVKPFRTKDFALYVPSGTPPLHLLVANPSFNAELLRAVLELDPSAASAMDGESNTLLNKFCACNPAITPETVQPVLELDPSAATKTNKNGMSSLFLFCAFNPNITPEAIRVVLELDPSAATTKDKFGGLPMHGHCYNSSCVTPETIRLVYDLDRTAIHISCYGNLPLAMLFLDTGASKTNAFGDTVYRNTAEIALALIKMGPDTGLAKVGIHVALHYACAHKSPEQINDIVYSMISHEPSPMSLLPLLLRLPTRTLERVASCPCVTSLVNEAIVRPAAVDRLVSDGSTRLLPLIGLYTRLTYALFRAPSVEAVLGGAGVLQSLTTRDRLYLLIGVAVAICFVMAVRELQLVRAMIRAKLLSAWLRSPQRWVGLLAPCVAAGALLQGCNGARFDDDEMVEVGPSGSATAAVGTILLTVRLLNWLQHWSASFAMFVSSLSMIILDMGPFLIVLFVALSGFSWTFFLLGHDLLKRGPAAMEFGSSAGVEQMLVEYRASVFNTLSAGLLGLFNASELMAEGDALVMLLVLAFALIVAVVMLNVLIAVISDSHDCALERSVRVNHRARLELAAQAELAAPFCRIAAIEFRAIRGLLVVRVPLWSFLLFNLPLYVALGMLDGAAWCLQWSLAFQYLRVLLVLYYGLIRGEGLFNVTFLAKDPKNHYLLRHLRHKSQLQTEEDEEVAEGNGDAWLGRVLDFDLRVRRAVAPVGGKMDKLQVRMDQLRAQTDEILAMLSVDKEIRSEMVRNGLTWC